MGKLDEDDLNLNDLNENLNLISSSSNNNIVKVVFNDEETSNQINQKVAALYNGVTKAEDLGVLCEFIGSATRLGIVKYTPSHNVLKERLSANASDPAIIGLALKYGVMHIDEVLNLILDNGINDAGVLGQACNKVVAEKATSQQQQVTREDDFVIYLEEQEQYDCVLKIDSSKQSEMDNLKAINQQMLSPSKTREQIIDLIIELMQSTDKKNTSRFLKLSEYLLQIDRGIEVKKLFDFYKEMMNSETWGKMFSELNILLDSNGADSLRGYLKEQNIESPIALAAKLPDLIDKQDIQQTLEHALVDLVMLGMYPYLVSLYKGDEKVMRKLNEAKTKFQKIRSSSMYNNK